MGSGHRQEGMGAQLPEIAPVRFSASDRGAISSLSAGPTIATSAPSMPRAANYCGEQKTNFGIMGMPVSL